MAKAPDIFHPLTSFDWKECPSFSSASKHHNIFRLPRLTGEYTLFQDKIYAVLDQPQGKHPCRGTLCVFSLSTNKPASWYVYDAPATDYALTTYNSQLVIVGGREFKGWTALRETTNKLWVSGDGGRNWECSLPPMPTKRYKALAMSVGRSLQCLIVAGGQKSNSDYLSLVEVLRERQWFVVRSPNILRGATKSTLHRGYWFLMGKFGCYCANVNSLLTSLPGMLETKPTGGREIWKECKIPFDSEYHLISFGEHLLSIIYTERQVVIYAYQPVSQSWVRIHDLHLVIYQKFILLSERLSSGELLVVVRYHNTRRPWITQGFRGSIKGMFIISQV